MPRVLDGGSEWTYGEPVRPGDTITFTTQMETLVEREGRMGSMLIATYLTTYTNQRSEVAATQRNTVIRMPGDMTAQPRFEDIAVGSELPLS